MPRNTLELPSLFSQTRDMPQRIPLPSLLAPPSEFMGGDYGSQQRAQMLQDLLPLFLLGEGGFREGATPMEDIAPIEGMSRGTAGFSGGTGGLNEAGRTRIFDRFTGGLFDEMTGRKIGSPTSMLARQQGMAMRTGFLPRGTKVLPFGESPTPAGVQNFSKLRVSQMKGAPQVRASLEAKEPIVGDYREDPDAETFFYSLQNQQGDYIGSIQLTKWPNGVGIVDWAGTYGGDPKSLLGAFQQIYGEHPDITHLMAQRISGANKGYQWYEIGAPR